MEAEEVDQVVGGGVQKQAKGVGQEAMTAEPVGTKAVLELFDAVLAFSAFVVESEDLGTAGAVGNQEAKIGTGGGVFGFVTMRRSRGQVRARWRKLVKERWGRWVRR